MGRRMSRQQQIIHNYYTHRDEIQLQSLSETVSELYLAETPTDKARLWKRVRTALERLGVPEEEIVKLLAARRPEALAKFITGRF